jgi:carboxylesterase
VAYTDEVVDIGRGLGEHLTLAGLSGGGVVTAWAAQTRADLDQAVVMSAALGFQGIRGR